MSNVDMSIFEKIAEDHEITLQKVVSELASGDLDYLCDFEDGEPLDYLYEHIETEGGGEGGAEYCYGVFKLDGKSYKAEWSYYSYEGCNFDEIFDTLKEVKPVEKIITVYEPI